MNQLRIILITLSIFFLFLIPPPGQACSAFCKNHNGRILLGANSDSCEPLPGLLLVNKKGVEKTGSLESTEGKRAKWVSRYGSVTLTYICREYAQYGMNEKGLVVSTVGLPGNQGPPPDLRPPLEGNFWSQHLLDTCATVDEVIASETAVRIINVCDQYLVCDRSGDCVVVETLDGKMVYYRDNNLPILALTNEKYATCLKEWHQKTIPNPDPYISHRRFQTAARMLQPSAWKDCNAPISFSFEVLNAMAQGDCTQWNVVFDSSRHRIYFRTKQAPDIRFIDLDHLDFSCSTPMTMLEVNQPLQGDMMKYLKPCDQESCLDLMRSAFKRFGITKSEKEIQNILSYFEDFPCK